MSEILENNETEEPTIIELEDDDGQKISFELLDYIEYDGSAYIVLLPEDDEDDDGQVVILEVEEYDDDTEGYVSVDDDMVEKIYEVFKERNADRFDFDD